jgi:hypothetical protein
VRDEVQHPRFVAFAAVEVRRDAERKVGRKILRHFIESNEFIHNMKQKGQRTFSARCLASIV